jgi:hypothetical protein
MLENLSVYVQALDAALPQERNGDEREALVAMGDCLREMLRVSPELSRLRSWLDVVSDSEREAAVKAVRRLLHDIRSPAAVLYSYLQLIAAGILFAHASEEQRNLSNWLVGELRHIRDEQFRPPLLAMSAER